MSRTREWAKFGSLVGMALGLAVVLVFVVDFPRLSLAQPPSRALPVYTQSAAPLESPPQELQSLGEAFVRVADAVRPAVVFIEASGTRRQAHPEVPAPFDRYFDPNQDVPRRGTGSGFLIARNGYILTNNHVVNGFDHFDVTLYDGRQFKARVVGGDANTDIAVIRIDEDDLPTVSLGDSDELRVGEWVLAIGNPLGEAFNFTVTAGIVSGRGRGLDALRNGQWNIQDFIQTDAAINPGNSGGPLVNIQGQVIGMNAAIASRTGYYTGYSFAIPINLARVVADQLIENGRVRRAMLGIRIEDASAEDAEAMGLTEVRGVLVHGFSDGNSPAEQAGIEAGDVIIQVDGQEVRYTAQLQQIVGFKLPGDRIVVTVLREGADNPERHDFTVQLREAETNERQQVARSDEDGAEQPTSFESKLGIAVQPLSAQMAASDSRIGDENRGPIITGIDPNGPAHNKPLFPADARRGVLDIITHLNDARIRTVDELNEALAGVEPGDIVTLRIYQVLRDQPPTTRIVRLKAEED
ncbi:MAG: trypsin-like peptidase domain-containing protein [Gemmatimonadales bacterium]